jgi:acetyl esterase/lipase
MPLANSQRITLMKTTLPAFLLVALCATPVLAETSQHDFKGAATAEIYKHASGDELWIYRFEAAGHDPTSDKRPAVVFFFGGGWNGGTVTQFEQHSKYLASRGMVAFLADYRVKSRQNTGPDACVADGKSAIRWVRKNAQRLGVDANRIAAGGGSAGGHVAATTGICGGLDDPSEKDSQVSSKADALLLFNPVYDNGPHGYGHDRVKQWFPAISPAHNITKDDPPTIVFLGSRDPLIPVSTARKFDADLKAVGVKSEVWIYEDQPHGFFNESKNQEAFLDTVLKMDSFLCGLGWLEGKSDEDTLESLLKKPLPKKG